MKKDKWFEGMKPEHWFMLSPVLMALLGLIIVAILMLTSGCAVWQRQYDNCVAQTGDSAWCYKHVEEQRIRATKQGEENFQRGWDQYWRQQQQQPQVIQPAPHQQPRNTTCYRTIDGFQCYSY